MFAFVSDGANHEAGTCVGNTNCSHNVDLFSTHSQHLCSHVDQNTRDKQSEVSGIQILILFLESFMMSQQCDRQFSKKYVMSVSDVFFQ